MVIRGFMMLLRLPGINNNNNNTKPRCICLEHFLLFNFALTVYTVSAFNMIDRVAFGH